MEIASTSYETAQRLMQALENSRLSEGSGLTSESRGPAPDDLVKEFRILMERPESGQNVASVQSKVQLDGRTSPIQTDAQSIDSVETLITEPGGLMSPTDLYRLQFSTRMLVFGSRFFQSAQHSVTSQFEQTLKSQN